MKVTTIKEAWDLVSRFFPSTDGWSIDIGSTDNAGYPIYRSTNKREKGYICDLGDRLEINYSNGISENIWYDPEPKKYTYSFTEREVLMLAGRLDIYCDQIVNAMNNCESPDKSIHYNSYNRYRKLLRELLDAID